MLSSTRRLARIAWLVVPTAFAFWSVATSLHRRDLDVACLYSVGPLLVATAAAALGRAFDALYRRRGMDACLASLDVLTPSGCWTITTSAAAVVLSVPAEWASLSVLGVLGLAVVHVSALSALVRVAGNDPWRRASLTRRFAPERVVEGDAALEVLSFASPRIPVGFRLFVAGRVGPRWPVAREVLSADVSDGQFEVTRDVGPAVRGVHAPEKLTVWLEDTLGLVHSRHERVEGGAARLTVLARAFQYAGAQSVCRRRGSDDEPEAARRLPVEGCQNLREYRPGDDARRVDWIRSLGRREIVVRLPDEVPPEMPAVELVLDTFQVAVADWSSCSEGPHALLDGLVHVWVGLGRALAAAGVRVVLVVAGPKSADDPTIAPRYLPLDRRSRAGDELGAAVKWQGAVAAADMRTSRSVVVSHRRPTERDDAVTAWIVVPPELWAGDAGDAESSSASSPSFLRHRHPVGAVENRRSYARAAREQARATLALDALFWATTAQSGPRPPLPGARDTRFWVETAAAERRSRRTHGSPSSLERSGSAGRFVARPIGGARFRIEELR